MDSFRRETDIYPSVVSSWKEAGTGKKSDRLKWYYMFEERNRSMEYLNQVIKVTHDFSKVEFKILLPLEM